MKVKIIKDLDYLRNAALYFGEIYNVVEVKKPDKNYKNTRYVVEVENPFSPGYKARRSVDSSLVEIIE